MMVQRARELCGGVQEEEQLPGRREIPAMFCTRVDGAA